MFQKKCIVCDKYKLIQDFGDELEEKTGYGLICRDCLIERELFPDTQYYTEPYIEKREDLKEKKNETITDNEKISSDSAIHVRVHSSEKNKFDASLLKTRIETLDIYRGLQQMILNKGIRTISGLHPVIEKGKLIFKVSFLTLSARRHLTKAIQKLL